MSSVVETLQSTIQASTLEQQRTTEVVTTEVEYEVEVEIDPNDPNAENTKKAIQNAFEEAKQQGGKTTKTTVTAKSAHSTKVETELHAADVHVSEVEQQAFEEQKKRVDILEKELKLTKEYLEKERSVLNSERAAFENAKREFAASSTGIQTELDKLHEGKAKLKKEYTEFLENMKAKETEFKNQRIAIENEKRLVEDEKKKLYVERELALVKAKSPTEAEYIIHETTEVITKQSVTKKQTENVEITETEMEYEIEIDENEIDPNDPESENKLIQKALAAKIAANEGKVASVSVTSTSQSTQSVQNTASQQKTESVTSGTGTPASLAIALQNK